MTIDILIDFLAWYGVVQLIALAALPLTLRLFPALPDRGYAFAKSLGILLVGFILWIGTAYGLLRNESGGAWLSLILFAALSIAIGWPMLRTRFTNRQSPIANRQSPLPAWRYIFLVEILFLVAFAAWTWVRAHDPAISHTEQPMDLMFMSGIWTSPTFPPRDPWLADYAISYYYFGYWLLITVARLAAQPPEIAYNLGQACWFGLLVLGSFGVGYNLFSTQRRKEAKTQSEGEAVPLSPSPLVTLSAVANGLLTVLAVALTGNPHVIIEWLYAQGVNLGGLATWGQVPNFPINATVSRQWFIDAGWSWWWRASRVIGDTDLMGNHIEVIDEFPMFSYVLGDNHPHVLAMPFVLLIVAFALSIFRGRENALALASAPPAGFASVRHHLWAIVPGGGVGIVLLVICTGALVAINTWDFPPVWALLALVALFVITARADWRTGLWSGGGLALLLVIGTVAVYFPYFLTAQSQAGGIVPNFFNPTRLPQFLLMFGHFLLALLALIGLAWGEDAPSVRVVGSALALAWGLPLLFLLGAFTLAQGSETGQSLLTRMALPPTMPSYADAVWGRWSERVWTLLLAGGFVALLGALLWQRWRAPHSGDARTTFALMLAWLGALLIFAPEFVYLRDNFGTRMNTVFKFYYQGWLLLGIGGSYAIVQALSIRQIRWQIVPAVLALLLILGGLIYPVAGSYAKIKGFGTPNPTLNGLAYVGPDEEAAIGWIRRNTAPTDLVLQSKGRSYWASDNRVNAATGRATLLGWDGHESQWRGPAYGEMAAGRPELIETIYRNGTPAAIQTALQEADIDYVYVGPVEREQYGLSPAAEARLAEVMDLVFEQGTVRIYQRRG